MSTTSSTLTSKKSSTSSKILIFITYFVFLVLLIVPLVQIVIGAFDHGVQSLFQALIRPEALHAMWITLSVVVVVTLLNTLFGILTAIMLVRGQWLNSKVRHFLNSMIDLPFAVSPVIGGFMIMLLLGPQTVMGAFFSDLGMPIVYAFPGMVLATLFVTFPLMVREIVPVLQEIGTQQEEAASMLGAYSWTTFWKVTWPSIRWGVTYGVVLTVARSLGEFGAVLVVSGNIMNKTQTLTTLVYQDVDNFNIASANSVALVLAVCSITLLLVMEWAKRRKGVHTHAH
ncbi:sulfate ABC transporter permease subunit [Paenibacillus sp. SC116]|uniref:sulfate ABC transporter permease subunit n=1 Tax=Paenibacillus sp. SC116 TaxID=2968986 RepID=UPI00215AB57D|nr:sulfate ABC transporter permease subunit [Paenibacillus sp. SC116]MCR8843987.1 sulfate ABC transporter permease subunit [Paenibacillus sp. SC116]